ncbi:MAG TPA: glutathione S-transferase [Thermoleophilaceae bacterium]
MKPILYVIPGTHPCMTARLMLEHKGIDYRRIDLLPPMHRPFLRALRFPDETVPALHIGGAKITNTRRISRALEERVPNPPLFPSDPERRAAVEEAERWGDQEFWEGPNRIAWWAVAHDQPSIPSLMEEARVPIRLAPVLAPPIARMGVKRNSADDEHTRPDIEALPAQLDKIEAWIDEGVLGGDELNAADYQIAPSLRIMMCLDDLRPLFDARPVGPYARRAAPYFPGQIKPVVPEEWLAPLREAAPAAAG